MLLQLATALFLSQVTSAPAYTQAVTKAGGVLEMSTGAQRLSAPGKPDVWLVGAVHIGKKQYYASLQKLLDAQTIVLFEGVKPSAKQPVDTKPTTPIYKTLSDALGLQFQALEINTKKPNWINSDLSWDDLDQINKEKGGGKPTNFDQIKALLDPTSANGAMLANLLKTASPGMKEGIKMVMVKNMSKGMSALLDPLTEEIIIHSRNLSAVKTFKKALQDPKPPKSVAFFWGAGHMPGIQKELVTKFGYKSVESRWFAAAEADPRKLDDTGKMIVDLADKQTAPPKKGG